MLCPHCYGKHVALVGGSWVPCPECAGVGELHCCDGLREQEECRYTASPVRLPSSFAPPVREHSSPTNAPVFN